MNRDFRFGFFGNHVTFIRKFLTTALQIGALLLIIALTTFRAQPAPRPQQQTTVWDGVYTEEQVERGKVISVKECGACHGDKMLAGDPSTGTLAGGAFLASWSDLTLYDLFDRMRNTMPENDPGKLSNQEYADILAFMLSNNEFPAGKTELSGQEGILRQILIKQFDPRPPQTTAPAAGSADSGKQLFASVGCAGCHGASANGGAGPQLAAPGMPVQEFIMSVRQPSGKMIPFSQEKVSDSQLADIYAFLRSLKPGSSAASVGSASSKKNAQ